ncbi:hypothetical protein ID866_2509 [Astraeus odoratus]|nr:hypothetical protein ID866_2509 [Astraeus odoratus]
MWWLDPGKDVLNVVFNRILAPYVENLDMNQVNYGIAQGQLTLRNLRLKKGALDKFRLPVDVLEGYLGTFTLSLHWMNLGNRPVEVLIEDVYLLVVPSPQYDINPEEEEERAQAAKQERLDSAELLHMRGQADVPSEESPQGLWTSLTAKIVNNLQVTVKNIHIRYEDKISVPGHPFAAGVTLASFSARKPHYDIHLLFDEIGVALDDNQYRDAISLVDMYNVYLRRRQYRKYRPSAEEFARNRGKAYLKFATDAILDGIRERRRKWSWDYFVERRNDRRKYVELFKRKTLNTLGEVETLHLQLLERKLSYEDIRFYRSIARSQLRRDTEQRRKLEEERTRQQQQSRSWTSWLWGTPPEGAPTEDQVFNRSMTEEERRQLYEVLDYDERTAIAEAFETPRDALMLRVAAELKRGSLALKTNPRGTIKDVISTVFDSFRADFLQRPDNFETSISLGGFSVYDDQNVASQTLEGLRNETRAGLEYALQTHKTIDLQVDMNAPVIIIPEDITSIHGGHLIIDAGHISIESDLVDKNILREIHAKRNQQYSEEDYKRLESMMYDKMFLRLESAQFVVGNDLRACRDALVSEGDDFLHLLERTNIELRVQNSIVPSAINLARFKVAGKLPSLHVNVSDAKYKTLMRLIDVAIPNFDESEEELELEPVDRGPSVVPLSAGLFSPTGLEYNIDDSQSETEEGGSDRTDAISYLDPKLQQRLFQMDFSVDELRATILKSSGDGYEKPLGDISLQRFHLACLFLKLKICVDVNLQKMAMNFVGPEGGTLPLISSKDAEVGGDKDLLSVSYTRVQKTSPDFSTTYDSIEQNVDVSLSTFIFKAVPEPVISLYDFIMSTFVPQENNEASVQTNAEARDKKPATNSAASGAVRVTIKLDSIQVILIDNATSLATVSLSTAYVFVLLKPSTMVVTGRLGSLSLSDDRSVDFCRPEFRQLLSIEGHNFAEFQYRTYDPADEDFKGIHFLEQPLRDIYLFATKLAKLKVLYDAARDAAVQRASEIERIQFQLSVKTPIVIFPSDSAHIPDVLIMRLGEIFARNSYHANLNKIMASLRGIQLVSELYDDGVPLKMKIVDDIDVVSEVLQTSGIDRSQVVDLPDVQVALKISDVKLHLTQAQYEILMRLSQSIPRVFASDAVARLDSGLSPSPSPDDGSSAEIEDQPNRSNLEPEIRVTPAADGIQPWTTIDAVASVTAVILHLYDAAAITEPSRQNHGIVRLTLNDTTLRYKSISDGASEAQLVLKSFTMRNTRPGSSKFREIIPAAEHGRNQLMILYTTSGISSLAIVTIDSPHIIFAIEPLFALISFFTSVSLDAPDTGEVEHVSGDTLHRDMPRSETAIRVEVHDVSISVLENDSDPSSQAIRLYINQILFSQQAVMALTVNKIGMSLAWMGADSDTVRFLDEVDLALSLDSRSSKREQLLSIEASIKPIILRASYRDIMLITAIVTKAMQLHVKSQGSDASTESNPSVPSKSIEFSAPAVHSRKTAGKTCVTVAKEQMKAIVDGFRLILIGDMHEQPMLHLSIRPFAPQLTASTTVETQINYWNLTNSHWEPLIDPWKFALSVTREQPSDGFKASLTARDRLDLNITSAFIELALTSLKMLSKEGEGILQKARGSYAPYRIRNCTGSPLFLWSDDDVRTTLRESSAVKVNHNETIDWRFDDWKTMREHVMVYKQHNVGVQLAGKPWEAVRGIPVDKEGEFAFSLRPREDKYADRLLCVITVEDNVKLVTLRSTYLVMNQTFYPLELMLVDNTGHPAYSLEKILPGQDYALPIEAVTRNRVRLQPDQGFGYKWCSSLRFDDLITKRSLTIHCPHSDAKEVPFRFQASVQADPGDLIARKSPKINLKLRAPIELENLLPYNIQYRIFDKHANTNWKSYLRKGGIMPVHSVELEHLVLLNVEVQDTIFAPSEFAIINTDNHSDFDIESRLTLRDQRNRKLNLRLNYVRYPESGGAFKVQIYSPYLIMNKSGMPFAVKAVRSNRAISPIELISLPLYPQDVVASPTPFMLSHPHENGHAFVFQVADSIWSNVIGLEAPAAETKMVIPSAKQKNEECHITLSWTEGLGKYKLTKVITLAPRFLLKNILPEPLQFREYQGIPRGRAVINPGERSPLLVMRASQEKLLTLASPGLNARWSAPINLEDIGIVHLRMPTDENDIALVKADIKLDGSIFVTFSEAEEWPFEVENHCDHTDASRNDSNTTPVKSAYPRYKLTPRSTVPYAWDQPAAKEKKLMLAIRDARRIDGQRIRAVSLDVRADGPKQVLRITPYVAERSIYKPKHRNSGSLSRSDTLASTEAFEAVAEDLMPTFNVKVDLAGIGISFMNRKIVEVVYILVDSLQFEYSDSATAEAISLKCGSLQIDNQLHEAVYPVILQPSPISREANGMAATLPTVQASIVWLKDQAPGQEVYFELLELQPIQLTLSFTRTERVSSEDKLSIRNPLAVVVNALTMTLGNVNNAPLELNALAIKDMRLTLPELQSRFAYHYRQDILRQLYRILGSADFIGNPVGLFTNVSSGVADIFYAPYNGIVMHGNKELGIGIAKGAASFVKKTVFGLSDSVTRFTSSVGKGLSAATFDTEYQAQRRMTQRRNRPRHAIYGVTAGGEAFANSVFSAVEGIVSKPLQGAETEGAVGFFKGIGKGLVGAVTKPAVGVFDLAANLSEGIRNTTTVFDKPERDRIRLPRHVPPDGVLVPYSDREALGQYWMRDLDNGAFRKESYVAHIDLPGGDNVVVLTTSMVLSFGSRRLRLDWDLPLASVQGVVTEDNGIRFSHKSGRDHDRFVLIPDKNTLVWFYGHIESVVKAFNARRRMDN